ncbi:hypothetical protein SteCoe_40031 [Stentor coeruleus]|uniref:Uncharacterized protein n=1 Tax=Stentor coeruleus TaxID=5963 RepID=A0A1R2AKM8_9CILI|nr:hypothetical protein SteCoe_40031 [Stentor coeruleus]
MVGETTKSTTNGKAVFYITFETVGETTLSASSDHDLDTIDSISKKVNVIESMCLETQNDVCVTCVPLANIIDGQCVCVDFSIEINVYCQCIDRYIQEGNECIMNCFNSFNTSDVMGYYNNDYKSISIEFESDVVESSESSCFSRITLPDYLNYLLTECKWKSSKAMILKFDSILNGNEYNIELDSSLTPVNEKCREQIYFLNLTVPSIELPMPELSLDGPTLHHLYCGNESLSVFNILDSSDI